MLFSHVFLFQKDHQKADDARKKREEAKRREEEEAARKKREEFEALPENKRKVMNRKWDKVNLTPSFQGYRGKGKG